MPGLRFFREELLVPAFLLAQSVGKAVARHEPSPMRCREVDASSVPCLPFPRLLSCHTLRPLTLAVWVDLFTAWALEQTKVFEDPYEAKMKALKVREPPCAFQAPIRLATIVSTASPSACDIPGVSPVFMNFFCEEACRLLTVLPWRSGLGRLIWGGCSRDAASLCQPKAQANARDAGRRIRIAWRDGRHALGSGGARKQPFPRRQAAQCDCNFEQKRGRTAVTRRRRPEDEPIWQHQAALDRCGHRQASSAGAAAQVAFASPGVRCFVHQGTAASCR